MGGAAGEKCAPSGAVTYRLMMFRPLVLTVFTGLGLVGVALIVNVLLATNPAPDPALRLFVLAWLTGLVWAGYWYLVRFAYEVGIVDGSTLRWRSIATSHEIPLARVKSIRTPWSPFGYGAKRISVEGDPSPLLLISGGIRDVIGMFNQFRPDLAAQIDWYDRMAERLAYPRSWGWSRARASLPKRQDRGYKLN